MIPRIWYWLASRDSGVRRTDGLGAEYFGSITAGTELRAKAIRGGVVTVVSQVAATVFQLLNAIVLARLITPRDFGIVIMVLTFSQPLQNFGENVFVDAIVQNKRVTPEQVSTLFWLNLGCCSVLAMLFIAVAPLIAWFYHEPDLRAVAVALAGAIVLTSLGSQHLALLRRNMQFGRVNAGALVAKAISVLVGITMAWYGWGYWSLVASLLLSPILVCVGAWVCCPWRPGLPSQLADVRAMIKFALHTSASFYTNYIGRNLDNVLVGWRFGSISLGNYKKAYDLFSLPASQTSVPLTSVVLSGLSRLRDDPERFRRSYLRAIAPLAIVGMGLSALLTLTGRDWLALLLGPKWVEAGKIIAYFGPGVGVMLLYQTSGWLHLSLGRADRWFRWRIVELLVTSLALVVGLQFGPRGVAVAWVCVFGLLVGPSLAYAGRPVGLGLSSILSVVWRYAFAAILAGGLCWFLFDRAGTVASIFTALSNIVQVVVLSLSFVIGYVLVLLAFPYASTFEPIVEFVKLVRRK